MADYKVTDTELTSIANAIRAKTGKSAQIEFPTEFVSEIGSISGGGGSVNILSGIDAPTANVGSDGTIYLQYADGKLQDMSLYSQNVNSSMSVTKDSRDVNFVWSSGDQVGAQVYKQIDLTDIDILSGLNIRVESLYDITQEWLSPRIFIENTWNPSSTWADSNYTPDWSTQTPNSNTTAVIDVSEYTGAYYVVLTAYGCNATFSNLAMDDGTGKDDIKSTYLKVNGAWQNLISSDIDDVNTGSSASDDPFALTDYIESSGTQYIDTGYVFNDDTEIILVANFLNLPASLDGAPNVYGGRTISDYNSNPAVSMPLYLELTTPGGWSPLTPRTLYSPFGVTVNNTIPISADICNLLKNKKTVVDHKIDSFSIFSYDGFGAKILNTPSASLNNNTMSLYLFGQNTGGEVTISSGYRIYNFKIKENGITIHDFVPWTDSNNVVCLKDTVTGNLKYNQGTGIFTRGTDE